MANSHQTELPVLSRLRANCRDLLLRIQRNVLPVLQSDVATQTVDNHRDLKACLECAVCMDLMLDPVTMCCGHSVCIYCIARAFTLRSEKRLLCPSCRAEHTGAKSFPRCFCPEDHGTSMFFPIGQLLGTYPLLAILIAISVVGTGSMGFLNFHMESRPEELWIDRNSPAYIAKTAAMTFPVGSRIKLSIVVTAPEIFQSDVFALLELIDETVRTYTFHGKNWNDLCFAKRSECQMYSLLTLFNRTRYRHTSPESLISIINRPGKHMPGNLPPYFISPGDILSDVTLSNSSNPIGARVTRLVYFLRQQEPEKIASSKPVSAEETLRRRLVLLFGQGFNSTSVSVAVSYADGDTSHPSPLIPFDYYPNLVYSCIAFLLVIFLSTGTYTASRHGFWLAISGLFGVALAVAFGFGIASAVGMPFTPIHFVLPLILLGLSLFGFLVMELELRVISDSHPHLPRYVKMGMTLQRSFGALVLCLVSNSLVFAVGIGSKLPAIRSLCVFGVTSSVGIFISQILFLFGCLSAWQGTYENAGNAWIFCIKRTGKRAHEHSSSLYSFLKPAFGFLASNLVDNIGRGLVLAAVIMLTAVCIYFLFSLRIVFDLSRFKENDPTTAALVDDLKLFQTIDDSIACAYLGNIAYHGRRSELATFHSYLREHAAIRPGSVTSWFDYFQGWQEDQQRLKHVSRWNTTSGTTKISKSSVFYQQLAEFATEENFEEDLLLRRNPEEEIELKVLVQKTLSTEIWVLFGAYFVVLLLISALMLQNIISALIVFISYALVTVQSIGLISAQNIPVDTLTLVVLFCFISIIAQMIYYVAAVFGHLHGKRKRKERLKGTMTYSAGPAVACALCAVVIFVPCFTSSLEAFQVLLQVAYTVIPVGLLHVILFVPVALSGATPEAFLSATLRLRHRLNKKRKSESPAPSVHFNGGASVPQIPDPPNDQVLFVARNPVERTSSTSSLRLHLKNAGLKAMLNSLPTPEPEAIPEETGVNSNPNGDDPDSLTNIEIPPRNAAREQEGTKADRSFPSVSLR